MDWAVGEILDGKVTGITKFGAFVSLSGGRSGMVHISEVAHTYVNDINEHLKEGQEVKVKIIGIDDNGRINLSIKKNQVQQSEQKSFRSDGSDRRRTPFKDTSKVPASSFEDKLKLFMQDSESRMSDIKHNMDKKSGRRRK